MNEVEQRIVAYEMALIEVVAHISPDHIREGMKAIRAGLAVGLSEEYLAIRMQALQLLEAALERHDGPAMGLFFKSR